MNIHTLLDKATIYPTMLVPTFRYFRTSHTSQSIADYLPAVTVTLPELPVVKETEVAVDSPVGRLTPSIRVAQWVSRDAPTVIYHHGTNENPYDLSFKKLFLQPRMVIPANLIVVRAPFNSGIKEFAASIADLANYAVMLATSVQLIEALVQHCQAAGSGPIVISGLSLGGFVTNLHHTYHNSADVYAPLLAGPRMEDVFLHSGYSKLVVAATLEAQQQIEQALSFADDFARVTHANLFPLLARYDQYIRYTVQQPAYGDTAVATMEKGHVTGALAYDQMRRHVLQAANIPSNT